MFLSFRLKKHLAYTSCHSCSMSSTTGRSAPPHVALYILIMSSRDMLLTWNCYSTNRRWCFVSIEAGGGARGIFFPRKAKAGPILHMLLLLRTYSSASRTRLTRTCLSRFQWFLYQNVKFSSDCPSYMIKKTERCTPFIVCMCPYLLQTAVVGGGL